MDEVIHITPRAAAKLKELRSGAVPQVHLFIRGRTCSGFSYGLAFADEVAPGMAVTESDGVRVFTDPRTAEACGGSQLDYVESAAGAGFTVAHPDDAAGCGCGGGGCRATENATD